MEVQRKVLLSTIECVLPAIAKKEIFERASLVAFSGGMAMAFDDVVAIRHPLPGDLEIEGCIDGRRLHALLNKLTAEVVDVSVVEEQKKTDDDDGVLGQEQKKRHIKLIVKAGRSTTTFDVLRMTLPIDSVDSTGEAVDLPDTFVDQLKWVRSICAKDQSRPALTCVLVDGGWMLASDSYRASRVECGGDLPRLMLPTTQVDVLVDYPIKRVALSDSGEWARFETDAGTTVSARSTSYNFPDLSDQFDVEGKAVELSPTLVAVLERARIFATRDKAEDEEVSVAMRPNQIVVSASCDGSRFSEVVRCEGAVEGVGFSIHPKFLASALASGTRCVVGSDRVLFSGKDWQHIIALRVK